MIRRGWSHSDLARMSEAEFVFWAKEQAAFDEAERKAIEKARKGR